MYLIFSLLLVIFGIYLFMFFLNLQFGAGVSKKHSLTYAKSKHWKANKFVNLEKTGMSFTLKSFPGFIKEQMNKSVQRKPEKNIEIIPFDNLEWNKPSDKAKFVWYGHSVLLLQIAGKNFLIDPMFGEDASPIGPIRTKRFSKNSLAVIEKLPKIDAILFTHDHYDHLDLESIQLLKGKVDSYFVALGVERHLEHWGIAADNIKTFDWWQKIKFENIEITFTPSRHFSGRGLTDRAKTLWGGWVFKTGTENIYWSGDGGYGKHFKQIGKELGPFDIAFMECGQYNKNWRQIHLHPKESVQAALDVMTKKAVPVHWAGFVLAQHSWKEPVERFTKEAERKKLKVLTPKIGQIISLEFLKENSLWFKALK